MPEKTESTRAQALHWWRERTASEQFILIRKYFPQANVGEIRLKMMASRIIEDIWRKEHNE